jgi:hypothetical protein
MALRLRLMRFCTINYEGSSEDNLGSLEEGRAETMAKSKPPNSTDTLTLGDYVRIKNYAGKLGQIVELRGPLGPNGSPVYRVQVDRKPVATFIELLQNQLEIVSPVELGEMRARRQAKPKSSTRKSQPKTHK